MQEQPLHGKGLAMSYSLDIVRRNRATGASLNPYRALNSESCLLLFQAQDSVQFGFRQNALGQAVADCRQPEGAADIVGQVPGPVAESQERFDGGKSPVPAGRRQLAERVREPLEISQGHLRKRLVDPRQKVLDVGPVGPLSVPGPAMQPNFEELAVGVGPGCFRQAGKNWRNRDFFAHFCNSSMKQR
jgi:hypothetical protein